MWDHRAPARPVGCLLAVAGAEVECCPPPEVGGQVWGWRAVVVPRVAAAAAMRHFPSCRVRHRGESWQRGVRPPTAESTHISLTERGVRLLSRGCGETPGEGNAAAEADGTAELCREQTIQRSSCSETYCTVARVPVFISASHAFPIKLTIRQSNPRPGQTPVQKQIGQSKLSSYPDSGKEWL